MGSERLRVLLADDHRLFREALRTVLERECEVVGEAASGEEAVALAARTHPDIVLLDVGMPGVGGLNAAHRLARESPNSKVVILSQHDDEEYVWALLSDGVEGYGYLPLRLPPGFGQETVHAADERVPVAALEFGTDALFRVVQRYRG